MFRLEGMGTCGVDELKMKSIELGNRLDGVCSKSREERCSLVSGFSTRKAKIHPLRGRGQMEEQ